MNNDYGYYLFIIYIDWKDVEIRLMVVNKIDIFIMIKKSCDEIDNLDFN